MVEICIPLRIFKKFVFSRDPNANRVELKMQQKITGKKFPNSPRASGYPGALRDDWTRLYYRHKKKLLSAKEKKSLIQGRGGVEVILSGLYICL